MDRTVQTSGGNTYTRQSRDIKIAPASFDDMPRLLEIGRKAISELCGQRYTINEIKGWLSVFNGDVLQKAIPRNELFVASVNGEIAGYILVCKEFYLLREMMVDPNFTRRGVGSLLLYEGLKQIRYGGVGSINIAATLNAESFYKKHGFTRVKKDHLVIANGSGKLPIVDMNLSVEKIRALQISAKVQ